MQKAIFTTTQSDLTKYNGTGVEVGAELTDAERDPEVGRMFHVIFNDGTIGDAFEDELAPIYNGKSLDFSRSVYEWLKELATTGNWDFDEYSDDNIGFINQGAVCCDLTVIEDDGFEDEDYCFGGKFVIDAKYFLLGEDTGYSEIKGVPYDCVSGFYGYLKDTYEETVEDILKRFDECLAENKNLIEGSKNTELTWNKVESYEGDVYPGYKVA